METEKNQKREKKRQTAGYHHRFGNIRFPGGGGFDGRSLLSSTLPSSSSTTSSGYAQFHNLFLSGNPLARSFDPPHVPIADGDDDDDEDDDGGSSSRMYACMYASSRS